MFTKGQQSRPHGSQDSFVFAAGPRPPAIATVSWQTERRGLMVLGGRPAPELMSGPARPRRIAGCCIGLFLASWDAGSALALSAQESHAPRQTFERERDHPFFTEDGADHPG